MNDRAAVEALLFLLDDAFEGDQEHSLTANLHDLPPQLWFALPTNGERTIFQLLQHVAIAKHLYADHFDGTATESYVSIARRAPRGDDIAAVDALLAWLREGQAVLRSRIAAYRDEDLLVERPTHWGKVAQRRWTIGVILQHDSYHAGEINHLRAICQKDDAWWPDFRPKNG